MMTEEMKQARRWDGFCCLWAQLGRVIAERAEQAAKTPAQPSKGRTARAPWHGPRRHW